MNQSELVGVPGVPESALTAAMLRQLPGSAPPAPWQGSATAVVWVTRGGKAAAEALPPKLRGEVAALGVLAGMVDYHDTVAPPRIAARRGSI